MTEFINKELAISTECITWATGKYAKENANEHFIRGLETYKEWLKNLSAADVAEVKHGEWVPSEYQPHYTCSVCGHWFSLYDKVNYCPNCGAKMDGGK